MPKESILIKREKIAKRVCELGKLISARLKKDAIDSITVLWLAEGAIFFAADLIRQIDCDDIELRSLKVSSYGQELKSNANPKIFGDNFSFEGKTILMLDDIFDTGKTAEVVHNYLKLRGARQVITCFLFDKKVSKKTALKPDYTGFEIENAYIFGYGLDAAEKYRNRPDVWKFYE